MVWRLLEAYDVYKLATGSGEQSIAPVEPVDKEDSEERASDLDQGDVDGPDVDGQPDERDTEGSQAEEPTA